MAEGAPGGLTADGLGHLLGVLASRPGPLPKYLYPSAGTLYPVQTYVFVPENMVEGLTGGVFYHDPDRHALARVADPSTAAHCIILLAGEPAAIVPIYGETARDFCLLEAGYMGEVLSNAALAAGLSLYPVPAGEDFAACPGLPEGYVPLVAWRCEPGQGGMGS